VLEHVCRQTGTGFTEVDILQDPELFARYRYTIPVLCVDGRQVAWGHFSPGVVRRALADLGA
jgi:hypothetical protein